MPGVTWFFDFISPYAYLGLHTLERLSVGTELQFRPVLFAGLLRHWGQKGPAEIGPKRLWTYRSCLWWANRHGVPLRLPAAHPFNPLPYLRLSIAAGSSPAAIATIFRAIWTTGVDAAAPEAVARLAEALGVRPERLDDESVKSELRQNTADAARMGVFGVPSLLIGAEVFWGSDAVDFAAAYLADPGILSTAAMQRAASIPIGAARTG